MTFMCACFWGCILLGAASGMRVGPSEDEAPGWNMAKRWTDKGNLTPPWGAKVPMPADCTHVMINVGPNKSPIRGDPGAFIILIDPVPEVATYLQKHHASATTVVYQAAISNFTGHAEFHTYNVEGVSSSLADPSEEADWNQGASTIQVPVHTLRELLDAIPPGKPITLLKTDMQGYDLTAIKSAGLDIKRVHVILAEVYLDGFSTYAGVHNELEKHWLPYMEQVGFEKTECQDAFVDEKHGSHELNCYFHQAPAA